MKARLRLSFGSFLNRKVVVLLTLFAMFGFLQASNAQTAQPADAAPDSASAGPEAQMPVQDIHNPIDFLNDETAASSNITVDPPGAVPNVVSVVNFSGSFIGPDGAGGTKSFPFTMMGNDPLKGFTTNIPTNIIAVDVVLLNADGTTAFTVPVDPFLQLLLNSPNFRHADYTVGHVQFADAVQRAEFFNHHMQGSWHTNLVPVQLVEHVTVTVPFTVTLTIRGVATQVRTWFTRTATDGNTVVFMLQQFFNQQFSSIGVNAINTGDWTTNAMNIEFFPNTFLFTPSATPLVTRGPCCVLGFHTFFRDSSVTPQPRWISAYASWTSPGTFLNAEILDVLPLSHEISEAFNDPFINNITPRWRFPGQTACQGNLETGDPVEVLAHPSFPVTLSIDNPDGTEQKVTFHPSTEALVQWFTQASPSDAFGGAFSYPGTAALPGPALPCQ